MIVLCGRLKNRLLYRGLLHNRGHIIWWLMKQNPICKNCIYIFFLPSSWNKFIYKRASYSLNYILGLMKRFQTSIIWHGSNLKKKSAAVRIITLFFNLEKLHFQSNGTQIWYIYINIYMYIKYIYIEFLKLISVYKYISGLYALQYTETISETTWTFLKSLFLDPWKLNLMLKH